MYIESVCLFEGELSIVGPRIGVPSWSASTMNSRVAPIPRGLLQARRAAATSACARKAFPVAARRSLHASGRLQQEQQSSEQQQQQQQQQRQQKKQKDDGPELQAGKSPFQAFVEVVREEIEKNRQLQQDMRQLGGTVDSMADTKAWGAVRNTYERARVCFHSFFLLT